MKKRKPLVVGTALVLLTIAHVCASTPDFTSIRQRSGYTPDELCGFDYVHINDYIVGHGTLKEGKYWIWELTGLMPADAGGACYAWGQLWDQRHNVAAGARKVTWHQGDWPHTLRVL